MRKLKLIITLLAVTVLVTGGALVLADKEPAPVVAKLGKAAP
jgi:hypothetical protein